MNRHFARTLVTGGQPRPHVERALAHTLDTETIWPSLARHTRLTPLYKILPNVDLLIVATRFVRKDTKNLVRRAKQLGIPVLMLPGGMSPSSIHARLREQGITCGGRSDD
jgi:hypothetical protein